MQQRRASRFWFAIVVALLLASIPSITVIPFWSFWSVDLHNLYVFHHCAASNNPYLGTGIECGDVASRDMFYPPALYWSFIWLRLVPFVTAALIWGAVVVVGSALSLVAWVARPAWQVDRLRIVAFILLLSLQFPLAFALERGNNDVLVLILWSVAFLLYRANHSTLCALAAVLAVTLKLYPIFAVAIVLVGLMASARLHVGATRIRPYAFGAATAGLLGVGLFATQIVEYVTDELPRFAAQMPDLTIYGHALHDVLPLAGGWVFGFPLLCVWLVAGARSLRADSVIVFAGALAISTYFAPTTYDYNLITTFPLLVVLFVRAMEHARQRIYPLVLFLGLIGVVGNRTWFASGPEAMSIHILLQWYWLMACGIVAAWSTETVSESIEIDGLSVAGRMTSQADPRA